jgi:hypothetical protein
MVLFGKREHPGFLWKPPLPAGRQASLRRGGFENFSRKPRFLRRMDFKLWVKAKTVFSIS